MEIVSVCGVISVVFSVVQLVILVVIVLHPGASPSSFTLGINECFERVAIGKRLNRNDVSRSVANTTLKQCDVECERETCNAYAYGIGPNGNGTCEISMQLPKSPPNEDPDYDLFIRILQCRDMTMCFRRLVNGRRLIDRYIRRTFPCDSLARCQLACSLEREFICEGFNYRFGTSSEIASSCQLTAMPGMNLDLTLDFTSDTDYDFYTRDRNAPAACGLLSYKSWNYYPVTVTYRPNDLWQTPTPIPDDYSVKLQPRIDVNDIYYNKWNSHGYECFVRARTGFRLHRQVVVMTLNAPTLYDCEFVCANERKFMCNILSYRYSSVPTTDNCMLGEKTIRQLEFYYDLVPDRDHDVYVRNEFSRPGCQPTRTWDSDCFERIRTGLRLEPSVVRFGVNTETLIDCELICLHIRHFTCRAFSFRYGPPSTTGGYNCLLTDVPLPEMDPRRHFIEDSSCELYHRGSYGHGCEIDQWPYVGSPNYTPVNHKGWSPPPSLQPPTSKPTVISVTAGPYPYDPYGKDHGNHGPSPPSTTFDPKQSLFPTPGIPYLPPEPPRPPEPKFRPQKPVLPASPTLPPKDMSQTPLSVENSGDMEHHIIQKICYIAYGSPARLKAAAVSHSVLVVNEHECKAECSRARDTSKFRCATISYWSGHCELSDIELRDLKPGLDFVQHDSYWLFSWDFTNPKCYTSPTFMPLPVRTAISFSLCANCLSNILTDGVWATFSVTGRPCRGGSRCSFWKEAGIYSCVLEDGNWDYCCRPDHHCGYSEGYNYPWCYVGNLSKEQWRPCNDRYQPYQGHKRDAPHWPISYVHRQGPPNNTAHYEHESVVDNFLDSLQFNKERLIGNNSWSGDRPEPFINGTVSPLPEFQVVDVTEIIGNLTDLSSNQVTSSSNYAVRIVPLSDTDKTKRSFKKIFPSIT